MKTLVRFAFLLCLVAGVLAAYVVESPQYALVQLHDAVKAHDVKDVEARADLNAIARGMAVARGARLVEEVGAGSRDGAGDLAHDVVGALARGLAGAAGDGAKKAIEDGIREGRYQDGVGSFVFDKGMGGLAVFGEVKRFDRTATVELRGTCADRPATVKVVLDVVPGPIAGHPKAWLVSALDEPSLRELAKACARAR